MAGVLIVGGGIGGLGLAVALGRIGIEATVYERAPRIEEVGAGISLWSNAIKALRRVGLGDTVVTAGSEIRIARTRRWDGRELGDLDIGAMGARAGAPTVCIHRGELQRILLSAIDPARVRTGAELAGFDQDAAGVTARFADGSTARGAVLVGADGIHSVVHRQLVGDTPVRYAGYTCYRGIARFAHEDLAPGLSLLGLGRGSQVGLWPCGAGQVYWFATYNTAADGTDGPVGRKRDVLDRFGGWFSPLSDALAATDELAILRNDIVDRKPIRSWSNGRVTLLGDAAHSTTPNLGQGACLALEDAVVLADALRRGRDDVPAALRGYEDARRPRTTKVTTTSWRMGRLFTLENRALTWVRDGLMSRGIGERGTAHLFSELLAYESPEL